MRKAELEQLARVRLDEAKHLFSAGWYSGYYYLGGYAAELALKACIAGLFEPGVIPDKKFVDSVYTHDLRKLVGLAGLTAHHKGRESTSPIFAAHWELVAQWSERARYIIVEQHAAENFLTAPGDPDDGVFEWIRAHW